ncbi:hypothetical protein [Rickettsiella endosymbiont of Miltochrista miniata]|uniref:hypothetical protein n=1 Tax=Rickettsiella endosymbiont of Miltochrista miniata TaxID=3066239 RepID=UPI00313CC75B
MLDIFFKFLKEINLQELKDAWLTEHLSQVHCRNDSIEGWLPSEKDFEVFSHLAESFVLHYCDKKPDTFLSEAFETLKVVKYAGATSKINGLSYSDESLNKLNIFLIKFHPAYQEYDICLKEILSQLKVCVENEAWNGKAKHIFTRAPDGIQKLRKLLANNNLNSLEKIVNISKLVENKYNTPSRHRDEVTYSFYKNLSNSLKKFYTDLSPKNQDIWHSIYLGTYSKDQSPRFTWITKIQLTQIQIQAEKIEEQLTTVNSKLGINSTESIARESEVVFASPKQQPGPSGNQSLKNETQPTELASRKESIINATQPPLTKEVAEANYQRPHFFTKKFESENNNKFEQPKPIRGI